MKWFSFNSLGMCRWCYLFLGLPSTWYLNTVVGYFTFLSVSFFQSQKKKQEVWEEGVSWVLPRTYFIWDFLTWNISVFVLNIFLMKDTWWTDLRKAGMQNTHSRDAPPRAVAQAPHVGLLISATAEREGCPLRWDFIPSLCLLKSLLSVEDFASLSEVL